MYDSRDDNTVIMGRGGSTSDSSTSTLTSLANPMTSQEQMQCETASHHPFISRNSAFIGDKTPVDNINDRSYMSGSRWDQGLTSQDSSSPEEEVGSRTKKFCPASHE